MSDDSRYQQQAISPKQPTINDGKVQAPQRLTSLPSFDDPYTSLDFPHHQDFGNADIRDDDLTFHPVDHDFSPNLSPLDDTQYDYDVSLLEGDDILALPHPDAETPILQSSHRMLLEDPTVPQPVSNVFGSASDIASSGTHKSLFQSYGKSESSLNEITLSSPSAPIIHPAQGHPPQGHPTHGHSPHGRRSVATPTLSPPVQTTPSPQNTQPQTQMKQTRNENDSLQTTRNDSKAADHAPSLSPPSPSLSQPTPPALPPSINIPRWIPLQNKDQFVSLLYSYYYQHGYSAIRLQAFSQLLIQLFSIIFTAALFTVLDFTVFFYCSNPDDSDNKVACAIFKFNRLNLFNHFSSIHLFTLPYFVLLMCYWAWNCIATHSSLRAFTLIHQLFTSIGIEDEHLSYVSWKFIVEKLKFIHNDAYLEYFLQDHARDGRRSEKGRPSSSSPSSFRLHDPQKQEVRKRIHSQHQHSIAPVSVADQDTISSPYDAQQQQYQSHLHHNYGYSYQQQQNHMVPTSSSLNAIYTLNTPVFENVTDLFIVTHIMRRDNILISLLTHNVIGLHFPTWYQIKQLLCCRGRFRKAPARTMINQYGNHHHHHPRPHIPSTKHSASQPLRDASFSHGYQSYHYDDQRNVAVSGNTASVPSYVQSSDTTVNTPPELFLDTKLNDEIVEFYSTGMSYSQYYGQTEEEEKLVSRSSSYTHKEQHVQSELSDLEAPARQATNAQQHTKHPSKTTKDTSSRLSMPATTYGSIGAPPPSNNTLQTDIPYEQRLRQHVTPILPPYTDKHIFFSALVRWLVENIIINSLFSTDGTLHPELIVYTINESNNTPEQASTYNREEQKQLIAERILSIQRTVMIIGVVSVLLLPFLLLFHAFTVFVSNLYTIQKDRSSLSERKWSSYAEYIFQGYNELRHVYNQRLIRASQYAQLYLRQFPPPSFVYILNFLSFVFASTAVVLLIVTFGETKKVISDDSYRSLLFLLAVVSCCLGIAKSISSEYTAQQTIEDLESIKKLQHDPQLQVARDLILQQFLTHHQAAQKSDPDPSMQTGGDPPSQHPSSEIDPNHLLSLEALSDLNDQRSFKFRPFLTFLKLSIILQIDLKALAFAHSYYVHAWLKRMLLSVGTVIVTDFFNTLCTPLVFLTSIHDSIPRIVHFIIFTGAHSSDYGFLYRKNILEIGQYLENQNNLPPDLPTLSSDPSSIHHSRGFPPYRGDRMYATPHSSSSGVHDPFGDSSQSGSPFLVNGRVLPQNGMDSYNESLSSRRSSASSSQHGLEVIGDTDLQNTNSLQQFDFMPDSPTSSSTSQSAAVFDFPDPHDGTQLGAEYFANTTTQAPMFEAPYVDPHYKVEEPNILLQSYFLSPLNATPYLAMNPSETPLSPSALRVQPSLGLTRSQYYDSNQGAMYLRKQQNHYTPNHQFNHSTPTYMPYTTNPTPSNSLTQPQIQQLPDTASYYQSATGMRAPSLTPHSLKHHQSTSLQPGEMSQQRTHLRASASQHRPPPGAVHAALLDDPKSLHSILLLQQNRDQ